jgi:hypothetical protein
MSFALTPPVTRAAFLLLALVLPASDTTPPRLQWVVRNATTNVSHTLSGTATMNVRHGNIFHITLNAIDRQGIHEITLGGHATWTCRSGNLGQQRDAAKAKEVQTLHPDASGHVLTRIFLLRDSDPMQCGNGFHFLHGSETFVGTGENYSHGKTAGTLTLNVAP